MKHISAKEFKNKYFKPNKLNNKKIQIDGFTFDSMLEADYYNYLKLLKKLGDVLHFHLQPKYILQKGFYKDGRYIRPITYKADFLVFYADKHIEVVDAKGFETQQFKIKRKMFEDKYSDLHLKIIRSGDF
jgi:hypothetical protein